MANLTVSSSPNFSSWESLEQALDAGTAPNLTVDLFATTILFRLPSHPLSSSLQNKIASHFSTPEDQQKIRKLLTVIHTKWTREHKGEADVLQQMEKIKEELEKVEHLFSQRTGEVENLLNQNALAPEDCQNILSILLAERKLITSIELHDRANAEDPTYKSALEEKRFFLRQPERIKKASSRIEAKVADTLTPLASIPLETLAKLPFHADVVAVLIRQNRFLSMSSRDCLDYLTPSNLHFDLSKARIFLDILKETEDVQRGEQEEENLCILSALITNMQIILRDVLTHEEAKKIALLTTSFSSAILMCSKEQGSLFAARYAHQNLEIDKSPIFSKLTTKQWMWRSMPFFAGSVCNYLLLSPPQRDQKAEAIFTREWHRLVSSKYKETDGVRAAFYRSVYKCLQKSNQKWRKDESTSLANAQFPEELPHLPKFENEADLIKTFKERLEEYEKSLNALKAPPITVPVTKKTVKKGKKKEKTVELRVEEKKPEEKIAPLQMPAAPSTHPLKTEDLPSPLLLDQRVSRWYKSPLPDQNSFEGNYSSISPAAFREEVIFHSFGSTVVDQYYSKGWPGKWNEQEQRRLMVYIRDQITQRSHMGILVWTLGKDGAIYHRYIHRLNDAQKAIALSQGDFHNCEFPSLEEISKEQPPTVANEEQKKQVIVQEETETGLLKITDERLNVTGWLLFPPDLVL